VQGWATHVTDMAQRLGSYFARAKTCQWVMTYLQPGSGSRLVVLGASVRHGRHRGRVASVRS
jgi:hypothetical protein